MEWGEKLHLEECTVPGPSLHTKVVVLVFFFYFGASPKFMNLASSRFQDGAMGKSQRNHCHDIKFGGKSRSLSRHDIKFMVEEKP